MSTLLTVKNSKLQVESSNANLEPSTPNLEPLTSNLQPTTLNLQPATPNDIAISARSVGKMYPLYAQPSDRLKQSLWYALPKFLRGAPREFYREFWALRDISFDLKKGETVGIIGRNGSGKSTLLQIIAGTLTPTHGEVQVNGRVAALLELGSGFNPEFTGRENVYLNGSILGLSQAEIDHLFDDITAFADIGQFIDQPVKHYSSGMLVRLAFAVQAFVPKEVLIVDEALAVGDMFFQAKCITKMKRMIDDGVTILFVSHDLGSIKALSRKCVWLENGELKGLGETEVVTTEYTLALVQNINASNAKSPGPGHLDNAAAPSISSNWANVARFEQGSLPKDANLFRQGTGAARFKGVEVLDANGNPLKHQSEFNQQIEIRAYIEFFEDCQNLAVAYHIRNKQGQEIIGNDSLNAQTDIHSRTWSQGTRLTVSFLTRLPLLHGKYSLNLLISTFTDPIYFSDVVFLDWIENSYVFEMAWKKPYPIFDPVHLENEVKYKIHKA